MSKKHQKNIPKKHQKIKILIEKDGIVSIQQQMTHHLITLSLPSPYLLTSINL